MTSPLRLFLFAPLFFLCFSTIAQQYYHLKTGETIKGSQFYILPKTVLQIDIPVVTLTLTKGTNFMTCDAQQLTAFKKKYGLDPDKYNKVKTNSPEITSMIADDSIKIAALATGDHDKIFYVLSQSKWNKNQTVTFTYAADGVLTEGESSLENKTFDIILKAVSGVAGLASTFKNATPPTNAAALAQFNKLRIEELDELLEELRDLKDQTDFDIYKSLKADIEKKYVAAVEELFYSEKKKITTHKILYTPKATTAQNTDIGFCWLDNHQLKFNSTLASELWGKNIVTAAFPGANGYLIKFTALPDPQKNHFEARDDHHTGIAFNIPLKTDIRLINGKKETFYHEIFKIPQFGIVGYTNTRKEKLVFSLDPLTGELKKLSIEGKAVTTDQIANTSATISEVVKAVQKEDEDTVLEKQAKRLENEKKIRDLQKELSGSE